MKRVLLSILFMAANVLLIPTHASAATFDEMKVVKPLTNTILNPRLPFDIEIEFIGKDATRATDCRLLTEGMLLRVKLLDDKNHAETLWDRQRGADIHNQLLGFSRSSVTPSGIRCSVTVSYPNFQWERDDGNEDWFKNWWGITDGVFGKAVKIDIAWEINGKVTHNYFPVTEVGTPTVSVNLQRGDSVIFTKKMELTTSFSPIYNLKSVGPGLCEAPVKLQESTQLVSIFKSICYLRYTGQGESISQFIPYAILSNGGVDITVNGPSQVLNLTRTGFAYIAQNEATITSMNKNNQFSYPAKYSLSGKVCLSERTNGLTASEVSQVDYISQDGSTKSCKSGSGVSMAKLTICDDVNTCEDIMTDSQGNFTYSRVVNNEVMNWTIKSKNSTEGQPFILGGKLSRNALPKAPTPKTNLKVSFSMPSTVTWPNKVPVKIKMTGSGTASCGISILETNNQGNLQSRGYERAFYMKGGTSRTEKVAFPYHSSAKWGIQVTCTDRYGNYVEGGYREIFMY